jgi:hypothetical protein
MRARHSGNTARGLRVRDLFRDLLARIGGKPDANVVADALACAEIKVCCEDLRAQMAAGDLPIEAADALVRLSNLADRHERRLAKFKTERKRPTSLAEILADEETS